LLIFALFKRAIVQSLTHSLFKKEQKSDCSFCRSFQKSNEKSGRSFPPSKRVIERK